MTLHKAGKISPTLGRISRNVVYYSPLRGRVLPKRVFSICYEHNCLSFLLCFPERPLALWILWRNCLWRHETHDSLLFSNSMSLFTLSLDHHLYSCCLSGHLVIYQLNPRWRKTHVVWKEQQFTLFSGKLFPPNQYVEGILDKYYKKLQSCECLDPERAAASKKTLKADLFSCWELRYRRSSRICPVIKSVFVQIQQWRVGFGERQASSFPLFSSHDAKLS